MARNYYSTQPFLAWCLNHFFYKRRHFAYVGAPFHPYRLTNPASSNPWKTFGAQYEPWVDRDPYDAHVAQKRINLRKGVALQVPALPPRLRTALHFLCASVDIIFFLPIVYRVDVDNIPPARRGLDGSGSIGSNEYLIRDLTDGEFEILFFDPIADPHLRDHDVVRLGNYLLAGADLVTPGDALTTLLGRVAT